MGGTVLLGVAGIRYTVLLGEEGMVKTYLVLLNFAQIVNMFRGGAKADGTHISHVSICGINFEKLIKSLSSAKSMMYDGIFLYDGISI